jgi:hypothetical protein
MTGFYAFFPIIFRLFVRRNIAGIDQCNFEWLDFWHNFVCCHGCWQSTGLNLFIITQRRRIINLLRNLFYIINLLITFFADFCKSVTTIFDSRPAFTSSRTFLLSGRFSIPLFPSSKTILFLLSGRFSRAIFPSLLSRRFSSSFRSFFSVLLRFSFLSFAFRSR